MSVEHISNALHETESPSSDFAVFIPGMGGTYRGNIPSETALKRVYGENNVQIFNSHISGDGPNPEKFSQVGQLVQEKVASGTHVDMIVNSLGGAELYEAIKAIEKREPDFFTDTEHLSHLDLTLISPVGFVQGIGDNLRFIKNLATFTMEENPLPVVGSRESVRRGIASLNTLPPSAIAREDLVTELRTVLSDLSQKEEGYEDIAFTPDHEFENKVSDDDREELYLIDLSLKAALEQRNVEGVKSFLKKRGLLLDPYTMKKFAGEQIEDFSETEALTWTPGAVWGTLEMFKDMISGEPMQKIEELYRRGMKVTFAIPEYDVLLPLEDIKQFFDTEEEAQENAVILPATTHNSFVLANDTLTQLMHHLRDTV